MIKRIAKKSMYLFSSSIFSPSSMILMLHRITDTLDIEDYCSLTKSNFQNLISQFDNWATLDDIVEKKIRYKISLTFDDGYADIYEKVYPMCKEKNIPFTIFITYDFLNKPGYLTKKQLFELSKDSLVTIGSHNVRHLPLHTLTKKEQEEEIVNSKTLLEEIIGKPIKYLAYPYGQNDKTTMKILKKAKHYKYAFIAGGICYNWFFGRNPFRIHRYFVKNTGIENCYETIKKLTVKSK